MIIIEQFTTFHLLLFLVCSNILSLHTVFSFRIIQSVAILVCYNTKSLHSMFYLGLFRRLCAYFVICVFLKSRHVNMNLFSSSHNKLGALLTNIYHCYLWMEFFASWFQRNHLLKDQIPFFHPASCIPFSLFNYVHSMHKF